MSPVSVGRRRRCRNRSWRLDCHILRSCRGQHMLCLRYCSRYLGSIGRLRSSLRWRWLFRRLNPRNSCLCLPKYPKSSVNVVEWRKIWWLADESYMKLYYIEIWRVPKELLYFFVLRISEANPYNYLAPHFPSGSILHWDQRLWRIRGKFSTAKEKFN